MRLVVAAMVIVVLLAMGLVACGGGGDSPSQNGCAGDAFRVGDRSRAGHGERRRHNLHFENTGEMQHSFMIVKSDLPPGELPGTKDGGVDISKLNVVGSAGFIEPVQATGGGLRVHGQPVTR